MITESYSAPDSFVTIDEAPFLRDSGPMRVGSKLLWLFLFVPVFVAGLICHAAPERPEFSRKPYIQFSTTNSIYVVWRTEGPVTPVVRFGTSLERLESEVSYVSET